MLFVMSHTRNLGNRYLHAQLSATKMMIAIHYITLLDRRMKNEMEIGEESTVQGQIWSNTWSAIRDDAAASLTLKDLGNHTG